MVQYATLNSLARASFRAQRRRTGKLFTKTSRKTFKTSKLQNFKTVADADADAGSFPLLQLHSDPLILLGSGSGSGSGSW